MFHRGSEQGAGSAVGASYCSIGALSKVQDLIRVRVRCSIGALSKVQDLTWVRVRALVVGLRGRSKLKFQVRVKVRR